MSEVDAALESALARAAAADARAAAAEAQAAELGLALDVLSRLVGVTSEEGVVASVLDCARDLIGADGLRLTLLGRYGEPARAFERGPDDRLVEHPVHPRDPVPDELILGDDLVQVPVSLDGRPLGVLTLTGLYEPASSGRYGATILTVARVAAMALANARAIKGLVPICAQCRRVRGEDGRWERIETWIGAHSQAELSHGLCPDCYGEALREAGLDDEAAR